MKMSRRVRRVVVFATAFVVGLWVADRMLDARPTTQATTAPATQASIDPAARAVLDRAAAAYAKLPVALEATLSVDFDVAGMKQQRTTKISASALTSTQFKHEVENEVQVVADGKSTNILDLKENQYLSNTIDKEKPAVESDQLITAMLRQQNPALLLAITNGSAANLFESGAAVTLDSAASTPEADVLLVTDKELTINRIFVRKDSGLIDHIDSDFRPMLEKQGASQINKAMATIRYTHTDFAPVLNADAFAFKPPADAIAAPDKSDELLTSSGDPDRLVGKSAPAFELSDPDGKTVSLESLKGKVVVLDFWATWCGPCRAVMPDLDALAKQHASDEVVVLAVNVAEEAETVRAFLQEQKLGLRAVLDSDRAVSRRYHVNGIPQTVVIGRDGNVRYAHVGATTDYKSALGQQIDAALK